ncbi:MAG: hypothetical protein AB7S26_04980 [Sandaracinaceae bacterium]
MSRFRVAGRTYRLRAWHEPRGQGLDVSWCARSVLAGLAGWELRRLVVGLDAPSYAQPADDASTLRRLADELERGRVWLEREPETELVYLRLEGREAEPEELSEPLREGDWIEIEVVDAEDQPVPFVIVEVELPNGVKRRSSANEGGWLRMDGIPSGQCKISFPAWDRSAWKVA